MNTRPSPDPQTESYEHEADFLKSELALSLTFSVLAEIKYEDGNGPSAERSIVHAGEAYATVFTFLTDPRLNNRLTDHELHDLTLEAERVRKRLEVVRRNGN